MITPLWSKGNVVFPVAADLITDRLTIKITSIDGIPAENAAAEKKVNIMPVAEYNRIPSVQASGMDTVNLSYFTNYEGWYQGRTDTFIYNGPGGHVIIPPIYSFNGLPSNRSATIPNTIIGEFHEPYSDVGR